MVNRRTNDNTANLKWTFMSVQSWAENSSGAWTLEVRDRVSGNVGTLNSSSVKIFGSTTGAPGGTSNRLGNISTRGRVHTGNDVLIGGMVISGTGSKSVLVRALGPTLAQPPFNLPGVLGDPTLELYDANNNLITSNDNWGDAANAAAVTATNLAPPNALEAAILTSLAPGNYTAIVRGTNNTTGVALVDAYDLDGDTTSKFANISTRGFVETEGNVMIAGVIVKGSAAQQFLIRALGPTLGQPPFDLPNSLPDPFLDVRDANGMQIMVNDNWKTTQQSAIEATRLAPPNDAEAAVLTLLSPGSYTAILSGVNNTTGNALVEVYAVN